MAKKLKYELLIVSFLLCTIFNFSYSQNSRFKWNQFGQPDSLTKAAIEECFGYKIKTLNVSSIRGKLQRGYIPPNLSILNFDLDSSNQIQNLDFIRNGNPTLALEDYQRCLVPHINLKSRYYDKYGYAIDVRFSDDISKDNLVAYLEKDLLETKKLFIAAKLEDRKIGEMGYFTREIEFNRCDNETLSLILDDFEIYSQTVYETYLDQAREKEVVSLRYDNIGLRNAYYLDIEKKFWDIVEDHVK